MSLYTLIYILYNIIKSVLSYKLFKDNEQMIMNIYYSKETSKYKTAISAKIDENALAFAVCNKSYEKTGWDFLSISSYAKKDNKYDDSIKAYANGVLRRNSCKR